MCEVPFDERGPCLEESSREDRTHLSFNNPTFHIRHSFAARNIWLRTSAISDLKRVMRIELRRHRSEEGVNLAIQRREAKGCLQKSSVLDVGGVRKKIAANEQALSIVDGCDLRLSEARVKNESEKE